MKHFFYADYFIFLFCNSQRLRQASKTVELDELVWNTVLTWINNPGEIAANNLSAEAPSFEEMEISLKNERLEVIRLNRQKLLTILMDNYDKLHKVKEEAQLVKQIALLEEQMISK